MLESFRNLATITGILAPDHFGAVIPPGVRETGAVSIKVYDWNNNELVRETEYPSVSEGQTRIGRERLWARLEWIMGAIPYFGGIISLGTNISPSFASGDWTPLIISAGVTVLGMFVKIDAERKRGITGAISRVLNERRPIFNY